MHRYIPCVGKKSLNIIRQRLYLHLKMQFQLHQVIQLVYLTKKQKMLPLYEDKSKNINAISSIIEKILLVTHQLEYTGSEHSYSECASNTKS